MEENVWLIFPGRGAMKITKLIIGLSLLLAPVVSSCGYDGGYRYPCQDPNNWENEECNTPICEVDGHCWYTLIGKGSQP
jgi:hypothetical protein